MPLETTTSSYMIEMELPVESLEWLTRSASFWALLGLWNFMYLSGTWNTLPKAQLIEFLNLSIFASLSYFTPTSRLRGATQTFSEREWPNETLLPNPTCLCSACALLLLFTSNIHIYALLTAVMFNSEVDEKQNWQLIHSRLPITGARGTRLRINYRNYV